MDLITQGLLGAACAVSAARRPQHIGMAIGIGSFAGMLADADVLIRSVDDPLLTLEYHRHFTHALLFVPFGALFATAIAWMLLRQRLSFSRIHVFAFLGYLPSGLLDACTSYGTQLLWPFSDARIAWSVIAVVDPWFSAVLLTGLIVAARRDRAAPARIALLLALFYLGCGVLQRERAATSAMQYAAERGHRVERLEAKPTIGNLLLWRIIYQSGPDLHVAAVRIPPWGEPRVYAGPTVARLLPSEFEPLPTGSLQARDLSRFERFSDGWIFLHPQDPRVVGDLRYAGVPNGARPLWGIRLDPEQPDRHVAFETFRSFGADERRAFLAMLLGATAGDDGTPDPALPP